jgi:hypothetical protein
MLICGWVVAVLLLMLPRGDVPAETRAARLWACLTAVLYLGGYTVLHVYDRFTWGAWGILLALTIAVLWSLRNAGEASDAAAGRRGCRAVAWCLAILLLVSTGYQAVKKTTDILGRECAEGEWLHAAAMELGPGIPRQVITNSWHRGLYFSYWTRSGFLGMYDGNFLRRLEAELRRLGPTSVLVFDNAPLADFLERSGLFRPVLKTPNAERPPSLAVLVYDPVDDGTPRSSGP